MAPIAVLASVRLAVLSLAVGPVRRGKWVLSRSGRPRRPRCSGAGRPAWIGRGMLQTGVVAMR